MCSGADRTLLEKCPTETSKYAGMGATVFFTGLFAALAAGYALHTVFDRIIPSLVFGLVWGLMIFNLDRYIVSSMRKAGSVRTELRMATPRIFLAVIISIVIARPLELKIFEKEIASELAMMEQEVYARQEAELRGRYLPYQDSLKAERNGLREELTVRENRRDALVKLAQEEADGTGGSLRRNPGPIYKIKKADADRAEVELTRMKNDYHPRIGRIESALASSEASMQRDLEALDRGAIDGPAARMEALSRLTSKSDAIYWAHLFIMLLFIAVETSPVVVKLISPRGPYDNLLRLEEHAFEAQEIETIAKVNAAVRGGVEQYPQQETAFVTKRLDSALK